MGNKSSAKSARRSGVQTLGIWRAKREVLGRARLQSCRNGGKISRALAPEVALPDPAGILRDYMPDSNEKFVGKDIVRTAWRHAEDDRNVHPTFKLEARS